MPPPCGIWGASFFSSGIFHYFTEVLDEWADASPKFLDYFEQNGHTVVASSGLVPHNDPTLLFAPRERLLALSVEEMRTIRDFFFGRMDRWSQLGTLQTDFTMIKAGALDSFNRNRAQQGSVISQLAQADSWGSEGPKVLWSIPVGDGYASPTILNGCVYLMDYDREKKQDALRCLSLENGQELWRFAYPIPVKRNHGMSRTVPTVTDKVLVAMGPKCHVLCLDPASGELKWGLDLVRQYGAAVPPWYAGQCPLIDGDRLILGTGGDALVAAVDCGTGAVLWRSPNPRNWQMTHSSITPMEHQGRRMYVYCGSGGVAGVAAADGAILWDTTDWKISIATIPSPLPVGDGRIFLCGGYNAGSLMLQLKEAGGTLAAEPLTGPHPHPTFQSPHRLRRLSRRPLMK